MDPALEALVREAVIGALLWGGAGALAGATAGLVVFAGLSMLGVWQVAGSRSGCLRGLVALVMAVSGALSAGTLALGLSSMSAMSQQLGDGELGSWLGRVSDRSAEVTWVVVYGGGEEAVGGLAAFTAGDRSLPVAAMRAARGELQDAAALTDATNQALDAMPPTGLDDSVTYLLKVYLEGAQPEIVANRDRVWKQLDGLAGSVPPADAFSHDELSEVVRAELIVGPVQDYLTGYVLLLSLSFALVGLVPLMFYGLARLRAPVRPG